MAFFSQLLLLEVPRVSAFISPTDKRTETRQPPLERVRFFLSCHVNNSISRFAAIRLVFQYWVTYVSEKIIKMENSHLVIFDEIWPTTLYYSTGCLARLLSNFKNS